MKNKKEKKIQKKVIITDEAVFNIRILPSDACPVRANDNRTNKQKAFREHNKKLYYGLSHLTNKK